MMRIFRIRTWFHPDIYESLVLSVFFFLIFGMLFSFGINTGLSAIWPGDEQFVLKTMLSYVATFLPALCWIYIRSQHSRKMDIEAAPERYDEIRPMAMPHALFFVTAAVLMVAAAVVMEPLSYFVKMPENTVIYFRKLCSQGLLSFFTLAMLPAFFEEFVFRGVILRGLLHHKPAYIAIFVSSFLFAFIHMNFAQGISAFLIGCLIGWIYYRTHSFKAVMLMHFTNNALAFWMMQVAARSGAERLWEMIPNLYLYAGIYVAAVLVTIGLILLLHLKTSSPAA